MSNTEIASFWKWFESVSNDLYLNVKNVDIISELDKKVKMLGPFDWEIGPVDYNVLYLAISPRLNENI